MAFFDRLKQDPENPDVNIFGRTLGQRGPDAEPISAELQNQLGQHRFASAASGLANLFFSGQRGAELRAGNNNFRAGLPAQGKGLAEALGREEKAAYDARTQQGGTASQLAAPAPQAADGTMIAALSGAPNSLIANAAMGGVDSLQGIQPGGGVADMLRPPGPQANTQPAPAPDPLAGIGAQDQFRDLLNPETPSRLPEGYMFSQDAILADGTKTKNMLKPMPVPGASGAGGVGSDFTAAAPGASGTSTPEALAGTGGGGARKPSPFV